METLNDPLFFKIVVLFFSLAWIVEALHFVVDSINNMQIRIHKSDIPQKYASISVVLSGLLVLAWIFYFLR